MSAKKQFLDAIRILESLKDDLPDGMMEEIREITEEILHDPSNVDWEDCQDCLAEILEEYGFSL